MSRIFVPADGVTDWRRLLAQPKRHWRTGYSAKAIAHCWQEADDLPPEIVRMFADSSIPAFHEIELLLAFPEYKVPLPGGKKASQNDVFVLAKTSDGQLIAMMVEAKVAESFGPILGKWNAAASPGKSARLAYIKDLLGLRGELPSTIRYQLLHRGVGDD